MMITSRDDEAGDGAAAWDQWEALFLHIERAPIELKIQVARAAIEDGKVDPLTLLDAVEGPLRRAGKVLEYDGLIDLLRSRFPDRNADGRHVLLERRIANALLLPGVDALPLLAELVRDPGSDLDGMLELLDWLRYHGRTTELVPTLAPAWSALSRGCFDDAVATEFCQMAAHAAVDHWRARGAELGDPGLVERIRPFAERLGTEPTSLIAEIAGAATRRFRREELDPAVASERLGATLGALGRAFGERLRTGHGWPGTRAELAELEVVAMIRARLPVPPPAPRARSASVPSVPAVLPGGAPPPPASASPLLVDVGECAAHLKLILATPHRAAALFAALAPFAGFLVERGLLDAVTARDWRTAWAARAPELELRFADAVDPVLVEDARSVRVALAGAA